MTKSRADNINEYYISFSLTHIFFFKRVMATNPTVESSIREPSADEIKTLSRRMGFVIKDEDISVYHGNYSLYQWKPMETNLVIRKIVRPSVLVCVRACVRACVVPSFDRSFAQFTCIPI